MKEKPAWLVFYGKIALLLALGTLVAYQMIFGYLTVRIENREQDDIAAITRVLKQAIRNSDAAVKEIERAVDLRLYNASLYLARELSGRKIENISQQELLALRDKLRLTHISLFVRRGNDIVVAKSTDPKEVGLSSKSWGYWFLAFNQLLAGQQVNVGKGYSLPNFWAGPVSLSDADDHYYKYAYYYDGTTNFIINPFISEEEIRQLGANSRPGRLIENLLNTSEHIAEITLINLPAAFNDKPKVIEPERDLLILAGSNTFSLDQDRDNYRQVLKTGQPVRLKFVRQGREYEKHYIPLDRQRLLVAVLDRELTREMLGQIRTFLIGLLLAVYVLVLWQLYRYVRSYWALLALEKERLAVAEDFKSLIAVLPNVLFKLRRDEEGNIFAVYSEGSSAFRAGWETARVKGKRLIEYIDPRLYSQVKPYLDQAFAGQEVEYNVEHLERVYHCRVKPVLDEQGAVIEVAGYASDITEKYQAEEKIKFLAFFDLITGLPNRTHFMQHLETVLAVPRQEGFTAILLMDLDRFKMINDTLGHLRGDLLLQETAKRLRRTVGPGHFLARMGGDEFILVLHRIKSIREIKQMAERIIASFQEPFNIDNHQVYLTTSIGISLRHIHGDNAEVLLKCADSALYRAKEKGKNNYKFYVKNGQVEKRLLLENELRRALEREEFFLVYQPKFYVCDGRLSGVEALVRWQHPERGVVMPADFIGLAEEMGLIIPLGEWILRRALRQLKEWERAGLPPVKISVNLSGVQFYQKDLVVRIAEIIREEGIDPSLLILEITETVSMQNLDYTLSVLKKLRELGVQISIDDFGTGYSALNYLKRFPVDYLKIDRSFVLDIGRDASGEAVIRTIVALAQNLGLQVVAEGVETEEQVRFLQGLGCHLAQGYYYSKPLLPAELAEKYLGGPLSV